MSSTPTCCVLSFGLLYLVDFALAQTCYFPVTEQLAANFTPCFPDNAVSSCCSPDDYCLTNGYCMDAGWDNAISRGACTDKTFGSPLCSQHCQFSVFLFLVSVAVFLEC